MVVDPARRLAEEIELMFLSPPRAVDGSVPRLADAIEALIRRSDLGRAGEAVGLLQLSRETVRFTIKRCGYHGISHDELNLLLNKLTTFLATP